MKLSHLTATSAFSPLVNVAFTVAGSSGATPVRVVTGVTSSNDTGAPSMPSRITNTSNDFVALASPFVMVAVSVTFVFFSGRVTVPSFAMIAVLLLVHVIFVSKTPVAGNSILDVMYLSLSVRADAALSTAS